MLVMQKFVVVAEVGGIGGTRTFLKNLLRSAPFRDAEARLEIFSNESPASFEDLRPFVVGLRAWKAPKAKAIKFIWSIGLAWTLLRRLDFRTTVIITVGTPGLFVFPGHRKLRVRYFFHTYPHGGFADFTGPVLGRLLNKSWRLVTVSDFAASELRRKWKLPAKRYPIEVLRTGLPDATHGLNQTKFQTQNRGTLELLCVAACEDYKSPKLWVEVADFISKVCSAGVHFTWVGGGSQLSQMRSMVNGLGLGNIVSFVGWDENVATYYERADIYLQLSKVEALGLSLIDAARYGLPSVVLNVGGMPEVVGDGITGIVCDEARPAAIGSALLYLINDNRLRARLGRNARRRYEEMFSFQKWESSLSQLLG